MTFLPEKEDKRISKTKVKLKTTLMELLSKKPIDDITVIQICIAANVTRITFYTYYADKFALAEEMFCDMAKVVDMRFYELEEKNNAESDPVQSYCNLLDSIVDLFYKDETLLPFSLKKENINLYLSFSKYLINSVGSLKIGKNINYRYPVQMLSGFLCGGLWNFICEGKGLDVPAEEIKNGAKRLIGAVIKEGIAQKEKPE